MQTCVNERQWQTHSASISVEKTSQQPSYPQQSNRTSNSNRTGNSDRTTRTLTLLHKLGPLKSPANRRLIAQPCVGGKGLVQARAEVGEAEGVFAAHEQELCLVSDLFEQNVHSRQK